MATILTAPNPILLQPSKPVPRFDRRVREIVKQMESALLAATDPEGVGLAAPQIGYNLRLFLTRPGKKHPIRLFINPEIISFSKKQQSPELNGGIYEGCLSIPGHYAPLARAYSIKLRYCHPAPADSTQLVTREETFSGFMAHIIQHEVDHLDGILFTTRCLEQSAKLFKVAGRKWVEIPL